MALAAPPPPSPMGSDEQGFGAAPSGTCGQSPRLLDSGRIRPETEGSAWRIQSRANGYQASSYLLAIEYLHIEVANSKLAASRNFCTRRLPWVLSSGPSSWRTARDSAPCRGLEALGADLLPRAAPPQGRPRKEGQQKALLRGSASYPSSAPDRRCNRLAELSRMESCGSSAIPIPAGPLQPGEPPPRETRMT